MAFSNPAWLWMLLALPLLGLLEWRGARRLRRGLAELVGKRRDPVLLEQRIPRARNRSALLRLAALALLVLGAAGPEWGREVVKRGATGSDVVLVMDVSASMDARDVPPSRLDEARREALAVVDRMAGSRIGLVAFAGDAVRLCPLTLDGSAVRLAVESLSTGSVSEPGTDLGRALRTAMRLMPSGRRDEQAIVIWTDGEATTPGAREVFDELSHAGIRVFAVGVGTVSGDVVPVLDANGHAVDVKRDEEGKVVRSRLDEDYLKSLAGKTRGVYLSAHRPGGELARLVAALSSLAKAGRGERIIERPVARFPLFALLAALLLLGDRLLRRRRIVPAPSVTKAAAGAARPAVAALLIVALLALPVSEAAAQSAWARGDKAFKAGHYALADTLYGARLAKGAPDEVRVNRATARALQGRFEEAAPELARLAGEHGKVGAAAGYNLGTLLGERQRYDDGLLALRRVLEQHPGDDQARWNYEVLLRRKQQEEERGSPPPNPQPNQQPQSQSQGGGNGAPQQQQQQPQGGGAPPNQPGPQRDRSNGTPGTMTREQADQLLDALEELARNENQRLRNVRVVRKTRGKDW